MSQPNFPNSPQPGDTYTYSGSVWTWTGAYWRVLQGVAATGGSIVPAANVTYDLGSADFRWRDLYLSGNTIDLGGTAIKSSTNGVSFTNAVNAAVTVPLTVSSIQLSSGGNLITLQASASGLQTVGSSGNAVPISGGGKFTYSNAAPSSPTAGDRWLDTETLKEFVFADLGATGIWIEPAGDGGFVGATGATGVAGVNGATGSTGPAGATGPAGSGASANATTVSDQINNSTGYFDLPSGTTAQRPVSPPDGAVRFNTSTGYGEIFSFTANSWLQFGTYTTLNVEYLVVAGGGGGGGWYGGSGGGAGGYRTATLYGVGLSIAYTVTVGGGGSAGSGGSTSAPAMQGGNGSNSVFSTITSTGGGGGGSAGSAAGYSHASSAGKSGGSGGGGIRDQLGGSGNTPSTTPSQGNNGGRNPAGSDSGGGGGGAGGGGGDASGDSSGGNGGAGATSTISGSSVTYAGGGGGGSSGTQGTGGSGGGGSGSNTGTAGSGTVNTGGGGGGGRTSPSTAGAGGSGIVILKYSTAYSATFSGGLTTSTTTSGNFKISTITAGTGTVTFALA